MFILIKKLWRGLCHLSQSEKVWAWPKQSKILIYDAANQEILLEYLKPWDPEILHVRREQVNMLVFLKSLFKKGRWVDAYIDCFIENVNPSLIVTIIDNNATFYSISKRHVNRKTLFFQNGLRGYYQDVFEFLDNLDSSIISTFFVDHMFVFGSSVGKRYSKYIKGNLLPIGSIKNNFLAKKKSFEPGVLAFISIWRSTHGWYIGNTYFPFDSVFTHPDNLVIQCLMRYAKENNKRLIIITCQGDKELLEQEKDYYRGLMGVEPEFHESSGVYSSYKAVDFAEVVVSIDSTLGYESIARGTKSAIFSIRSTLLRNSAWNYGWPADFPDEGPFWTNKPDPDSFVRILDYLFAVTDGQWQKDLKSTNYSSIMNFDPGNKILQSILEKELGAPPTSSY
jgi:surface carbohydrate biosynthesis protein